MKMHHWIWLVALGAGLAAGLTFAWVIAPARGLGTPPRSLRADYQDQWRETIATSYSATGDLSRARARMQLLGDMDPVQALSAQAQRALASGRPFEVAQGLARLASDLQAGVSSLPSRTAAPIAGVDPVGITPTPSAQQPALSPLTPGASAVASPATPSTAFPTPSPFVSPTPLPSPSAPFRLVSRENVCEPNSKPGLLQVTVLDSKSSPLPGVEITITWNQGADRFFTGFQPELSAGYADYTMKGGTTYTLQVARLGVPVSGLTPPICSTAANQPFLGGLKLTFAAP